jgi:hypothetical protein
MSIQRKLPLQNRIPSRYQVGMTPSVLRGFSDTDTWNE